MNEHSSKQMTLHSKIFVGLLVGAIAGAVAQATVGAGDDRLHWIVDQITKPVGQLFLRLIFMVVVPLLVSALVLGVADIGDAKKVGRVGLRSLMLTVLLSSIAVFLALGAVNLAKPGTGISAEQREKLTALYGDKTDAAKMVEQSTQTKSVGTTLIEFVPKNPVEEAARALDGGLLPLMVFALFFGIAMSAVAAETALPVRLFFEGLFAISQKVIEFAMKFAPIGVCALIFSTTSLLGLEALFALGKYAVLVLIALALHQFGTYSLVLMWIAKYNPRLFFKRIRSVMITAFATSSSNATLPEAMRCADEDLGLPRDTSSFVLTLGATANQNGTALFEGVTVIFLAQVFGINLDLQQQLVVLFMAILAGVGTAGVPGGSWPMIAVICAKVGVPPEAIGLALGVDRILDMSRTVLNVTGDLTIATCVSALEARSAQTERSSP